MRTTGSKSFRLLLLFLVLFDLMCDCRINHGQCISVGIVTHYGLHDTRIKSQWGARYSAPVHTGPTAHPASYTMGTGSFGWVKSGRGMALNTHPSSSANVKE